MLGGAGWTRWYQGKLQRWAAETWQAWQESTKGKEAHFMHWKSLEKIAWKSYPFSVSTRRCVTVKEIPVAGGPFSARYDLAGFGGLQAFFGGGGFFLFSCLFWFGLVLLFAA